MPAAASVLQWRLGGRSRAPAVEPHAALLESLPISARTSQHSTQEAVRQVLNCRHGGGLLLPSPPLLPPATRHRRRG